MSLWQVAEKETREEPEPVKHTGIQEQCLIHTLFRPLSSSLLGIHISRYQKRFLSLYKLTCCVLLSDTISSVSLYFEISRLIYKYIASSDRCVQPLCQGKLLIWLNLWNSALFLHRAASYRIWVGEQLHSENVSFSVCQSEQLYLLYSILPWKVGLMSAPSYVQNEVKRKNKIVCRETKWDHFVYPSNVYYHTSQNANFILAKQDRLQFYFPFKSPETDVVFISQHHIGSMLTFNNCTNRHWCIPQYYTCRSLHSVFMCVICTGK